MNSRSSYGGGNGAVSAVGAHHMDDERDSIQARLQRTDIPQRQALGGDAFRPHEEFTRVVCEEIKARVSAEALKLHQALANKIMEEVRLARCQELSSSDCLAIKDMAEEIRKVTKAIAICSQVMRGLKDSRDNLTQEPDVPKPDLVHVFDRHVQAFNDHSGEIQRQLEHFSGHVGLHAKAFSDHRGEVQRQLEYLSGHVDKHFENVHVAIQSNIDDWTPMREAIREYGDQIAGLREHVKRIDGFHQSIHDYKSAINSDVSALTQIVQDQKASFDLAVHDIVRAFQEYRAEVSPKQGEVATCLMQVQQAIEQKDADKENRVHVILTAIDKHRTEIHGELRQLHAKVGQGSSQEVLDALLNEVRQHKHDVASMHQKVGDSAAANSVFITQAIDDQKQELGAQLERVHARHAKFDTDLEKVMEMLQTQQNDIGSNFDRISRKVDQGLPDMIIGPMQKAIDDHKEEMEIKAHNTVDRDLDNIMKMLQSHKEEVKAGQVQPDVIIAALQKTMDDHRAENQIQFDNHKAEIGSRFDSLHHKITDNTVDRDLDNLMKSLQSHKEGMKAGQVQPDVIIAALQKTMDDHKAESQRQLDNHKEEMLAGQVQPDVIIAALQKTMDDHKAESQRQLDNHKAEFGSRFDCSQDKVGGDLDKVMEMLQSHKDEMKAGNGDVGTVLKMMQSQKEEMGMHLDRIYKSIDQVQPNILFAIVQKAVADQMAELALQLERLHKGNTKCDADLVKTMKILQLQKEETANRFDRLQKKVDETQLEMIIEPMQKAIDAHKDEMGTQFELVHRKIDPHSTKVDRDLEKLHKVIQALKDEIGKDVDLVRRKLDQLYPDIKQNMDAHKAELESRFDGLHLKIERISFDGDLDRLMKMLQLHKDEIKAGQLQPDMIITSLQKAIDYNKAESQRQLDNHKVELCSRFDSLHHKIAQNTLGGELGNLMKTLHLHKEEIKAGQCQPDIMIAALQKTMDEHKAESQRQLDKHKAELGSRFDCLHYKIEQDKGGGDLDKFTNMLQSHKHEMRAGNADGDTDRVLKIMQSQKEEMGMYLDRIHKRIDQVQPNILFTHVQKAVEDQKGELVFQLERLHEGHNADLVKTMKILQLQKEEMANRFDRLQKKVDETQLGMIIEPLQKAIDAHKVEMGTQFDRVHRKIDPNSDKVDRDLEKLHKEIQALQDVIRKDVDQVRGKLDQMYPDIKQNMDAHKADLDSRFDSLHLKNERNNVDGDFDKLRNMLRLHKDEIKAGQFQPDLIITAVQKAIDDNKTESQTQLDNHKAELGSRFDSIHRMLAHNTVDRDLDRLMKTLQSHKEEMKAGQVQPDAIIAALQKTLDDHKAESQRQLDNHKADFGSRFDSLHHKMAQSTLDGEGNLMKTLQLHKDEHKAESQRQFDKHKAELGSRFDGLHHMIAHNTVDRDLDNLMKTLQSHKEEMKAGQVQPDVIIAALQKTMDDHKLEMGTHFESLVMKLLQSETEQKSIHDLGAQMENHFEQMHKRMEEDKVIFSSFIGSISNALSLLRQVETVR